MYNVLLVDDENLILNGLKNIIDWEELSLKVIDTALNGNDALEKFENNHVDIIITDIKMPKMSGLDLIKKVKEIDSNVKFIILSGYDDFNYAKQAVSLGIENYILKPINEEELIETLKNTIQKIEMSSRKPIIEEKNLEILRENILYRWVANSISSYELEERSFVLGIDLKYEFYCAGIIKFSNILKSEIDKFYRVKEIVKNKSSQLSSCVIFNDIEGNMVIVYGSNNFNEIEKKFKSLFQITMEEVTEKIKLNIFMTIGEIEKGFKNIYKSYSNARDLQEYILVKGYNNIVSNMECNCESNDEETDDFVDIKEYSKALLSKNTVFIEEYIDGVFNKLCKLRDINPKIIQNSAIRMLLTINKSSQELGIDSGEDEENLKELIFNVCSIKTIEDLKIKIKQESCNLINKMTSNSGTLSPVIQQVVLYIKSNYQEELSLKTLGHKFNINPSYLGQIFHREVGEQFSDYLNRIKNEKAKEFLLNTNLKINEIAGMVGYVDTSYFYRKFKEYYGVSPNTLRNIKSY